MIECNNNFLFIKFKFLFLVVLFQLSVFSGNAQKVYTLSEAIETARDNNPSLKIEKYSINLAHSYVKAAKYRPNPLFNSQTYQLMNNKFATVSPNLSAPSNHQVLYQLTKPMLLGNIRGRRITYAKQNVSASSIAFHELNRKVSYEVALKWMDVWLVKTNLLVFKDAKATIDSLVYLNSLKKVEGYDKKVEFIRSQLLSDQYHIQLKALEKDFKNEIRNLTLLIGKEEVIDISIDQSVIPYNFFENLDTLFKIASNKRTDLAFSKSIIGLNKQNIAVQKSARLPYLEAGFIFNPQNAIPYAGTFFTLAIPLFSRNQGGMENAAYLLKQSESALSAKELTIKVEVMNAYTSFVTNKNNVEEFKHMEDQSILLMNMVRENYLKGNTTLLDYLESMRTNLETQRIYHESLYEFRKSYIDILYTTGLISDF